MADIMKIGLPETMPHAMLLPPPSKLAQLEQVFELPATFTSEKREQLFQGILLLYDYLNRVVDSVMADDVMERDKLLAITTPFLTQARFTTDVVTALYNEVVFYGRPITQDLRDTMQDALHNMFCAVREFSESMHAAFVPPDEIDPAATTVTNALAFMVPPLPQDEA
jgi:hypothetical protein